MSNALQKSRSAKNQPAGDDPLRVASTVRRKILTGEILTNLTNFQQFVNIFPIKIFRLVSYLYEMNE